jgi:hypothetical protein
MRPGKLDSNESYDPERAETALAASRAGDRQCS